MGRQEKHEQDVRSLLDRYYYMKERSQYGGDFEAADEIADLATAIKEAGLTEKQREALRLVYVELMQQKDVAKQLGTSKMNTSLHVNAAIRKIAEVYKQWEELDNEL